jgi:hypothetical protein
METKTCTKCQNIKCLTDFSVRDKKTGKLNSWCRDCRKEYASTWWKSNNNEMKTQKKNWYEINKEEQKEKCRNRYHAGDKQKHAHVVWRNKLIREFGITEHDYNLRLNDQNEACKICGKKDDQRLAVDHCHRTGVIRGLLCRRCNMTIGLLEDNPCLIRSVANYIEENSITKVDFPESEIIPTAQ